MKTCRLFLLSIFLLGSSGIPCLSATTRYVSLDGTNDTAGGYTTWSGAATNIQYAVSKCTAGDWIWVSNGTYEVGTILGELSANRVYINKAVTVSSWNNDREHTIIKGGEGVRPVAMAAGATLIGFTLTNGVVTSDGGGLKGPASSDTIVSNCVISGNMCSLYGGGLRSCGLIVDCDIIGNVGTGGAGGVWGNADTVVSHCNIIGNRANDTGGCVDVGRICDSTIISNTGSKLAGGARANGPLVITNCTINYNHCKTGAGGVAGQYIVYNCEIRGNSSGHFGGGLWTTAAFNCNIISNIGSEGGGVYRTKLSSCRVIGNSATNYRGGGVYYTAAESMTNCLIVGNQASGQAGGVWGNSGANIYNCTITGNKAVYYGGVRHVTNHNTISWNNSSVDHNYTAYYSCGPNYTGIGSIKTDPMFVDPGSGDYGTNFIAGDYRLQRGSPCINTGTNLGWMATAVDLDGHARIDPVSRKVDMGAYEFLPQGLLMLIR